MFNFEFPKWFNKWNRENPTDIYGPAILIGVAGGAVLVAALLVAAGQPYATVSAQTGPAGTGMSVQEFEFQIESPDPTVQAYMELDPAAADAEAGGVPVEPAMLPPSLQDLPAERQEELVRAMRAWTGIPILFGPTETYQTVVARRMVQMTQTLNEQWAGHTNASGQAGVNCYTCHRGEAVPSDIWFRISPQLEQVAGWSANQNVATMQTVQSSLPHDALEKYLLEDNEIKVHDLQPRVAGSPADEGFPSIQDTERTYSLMNYFANSLGVNCVFCHNSRAFYDTAQVTPQWANAFLGIDMVQNVNNEYLVPLKDEYPEARLGPKHGDAPKAACRTCHKGYNKPMGGMDMISDWPELATTGGSS
jgi:photosynthetic reaction center cytochrome c subunit